MSNSKASRIHIPKTFREALVGYIFNVCGLIAGVIIALKSDIFSISSWTVAVYPAILSGRGIIGGLFTGRLSTALHLGTIFPRVFENTKNFRMLFKAIITLTFEVGVIISLFSMVSGSLFWRVALSDFPKMLTVILATMALGLLIAFITLGFSFMSFKYGLDPDVFLYPAVSAFSDILITSSYIWVLSLFSSPNPLGRWSIAALGLLLTILAVYNLVSNFGEKTYTKTLKESFITLILVAIIVNFTGTILKVISKHVHVTRQSEVLVVYPALIAIMGSVGAIVGSTATTKLALGLIKTSFSEIRHHMNEILSTWIASIPIVTMLSFLALSLARKLSLSLFFRFTLTLLITNVTAAVAVVSVSFVIAILTFKRGLDPDNFVIPIESVFADGVTSVSLLMALFLVGQI